MVRAHNPRDLSHQVPDAPQVGVRIDEYNHRGALGGKVIGVGLVTCDIAVVAYPAVLVLKAKPIQRTLTL